MSLTKQLLDLFLLNQQIRGMSRRLDSSKSRLGTQTTRLTQFHQQHAESGDQLRHARAKANELEKQAEEFGQRIDRERELMNTAKNNKQYSALLIEVNTLKLEKGKVEDEALEQMNQIDILQQEMTELEQRVGEQQKLVNVAESEVEACRQEVGQKLDALTSERGEAEKQLPPGGQATFRRLVNMHEAEPMAPVVEESRRNMEYSCGGCYLSIPVEHVNTLMINDSEVVICPSCSRMLYLDQQLKASFAK